MKLHIQTRSQPRLVAALVIGIFVIALTWVISNHQELAIVRATVGEGGKYEMLEDDMGDRIKIGVPLDISEQALRAALVQAANDHQDDAARDYLTSLYLWVDAYLVKDGKRSSIAAGRLRRIVPFANPSQRKKMVADRTRTDEFKSTLDQARKSLLR
jgi:hypothetical protein